MQTLERFFFQGKTAVKFKTLQFSKILDINTNRIFLIPFKFMYKSLGYTQFEKPFRSKQIRLIRWDKQKISLTNAFVLFFYMEGILLKYNNVNNNIYIATKIYVKIPSLLPIILAQSRRVYKTKAYLYGRWCFITGKIFVTVKK